jgi:small subunit ribosomal protein S21
VIGGSLKNPRKDSLSISIGSDEDPVSAIRRFTKKVRNSGVFQELLQRRHYEKPSVKRKKKHIRAIHSARSEEKDE